jgi:hypothetical protein
LLISYTILHCSIVYVPNVSPPPQQENAASHNFYVPPTN